MKKYLQLNLADSAPAVPTALDQRILAAAAMRANGFKHRHLILRFILPATASAAAAAAALLITGTVNHEAAVMPQATEKQIAVQPRNVSTQQENNMLNLADLTMLDQGYFSIAMVSETAINEDIWSM